MNKSEIYDRVAGSLIAGAAGDALGYEVEFKSLAQILKRYDDPRGITAFALSPAGVAEISDDTQMTVATAIGMLNAAGDDYLQEIKACYIDWYCWQTMRCTRGAIPEYLAGWMIPDRAPGNTCMSALHSLEAGEEPHNNSKGCGGVMRIAPIALYGAARGNMNLAEVMELAYDAAYLTHKHPLACLPSAFVAGLIYQLVKEPRPTRDFFKQAVLCALDALIWPMAEVFRELVGRAVALAEGDGPDFVNIRMLGEGWVGDEAAAIAIYCALRHFDSVESALIAAVNHDGDSDSSGAVCGNIIGAAKGIVAIPQKFMERLEMLPELESIAGKLAGLE